MARVIGDAAREGVDVAGLAVRLVELEPGTRLGLAGDGETMAYVVAGRGETPLGALTPESLVWIDPGEELALEAGPTGLRLLVGHAR